MFLTRQAMTPAGSHSRRASGCGCRSGDCAPSRSPARPVGHRPGCHRRRHRRDDAVAAHACGPARACGRWVQPRQRGPAPATVAIRLAPALRRSPARADPLPRTRVYTIAVSRSCTCASTGSPSFAFHGGHRPGRCRQPGEPAFPPACASAAAPSCIPGCTPRTGKSPPASEEAQGTSPIRVRWRNWADTGRQPSTSIDRGTWSGSHRALRTDRRDSVHVDRV